MATHQIYARYISAVAMRRQTGMRFLGVNCSLGGHPRQLVTYETRPRIGSIAGIASNSEQGLPKTKIIEASPIKRKVDGNVKPPEVPDIIPRKEAFSSAAHGSLRNDQIYDVFIVGGGVTGTALLYELAVFTDLKRLGLVERRGDFAQVASFPHNNSQTIHCGDIETNYMFEKARMVSRQANMLRNWGTKLPSDLRDRCIVRMPKMVLGVGEEETEFLAQRFNTFKKIFPHLKMMTKQEVRMLEPWVVLKNTYCERPEKINALGSQSEHSGVDYHQCARAFVNCARETDKQVDVAVGQEAQEITMEGELFSIRVGNKTVQARFVVVSACGHSLLLAQRMGYGTHFSCLPMAGSFYFTKPILNGKVYTCQDPALPFAAVHGDPDIVANGKTRFGPTALPLPVLERYNSKTFWDFLKVLNFDTSLLSFYMQELGTKARRNYVMRNFLFEVPILNKHLFQKDVSKIIPAIKAGDLKFARGFGGVRPQLVDKVQRKLIMGEGKINPGTGIIFNVTPSPGGTTCLGNGEMDMREICSKLGATINETKFSNILLQGEYPVVQ